MKSSSLFRLRSRRSEATRRSRWFQQSAALLALAGLPCFAQAANTESDFIGSTNGSFSTTTNFSLLAVPTVANDVVFPVTAGTGIRTVTATNITVGSLNDLSLGTTVSIANATGTATSSNLTLGGAGSTGNSVSGTTADLFYVTTGGTFNINAANSGTGTGTLNLLLGQSGNFNVAGTSTITSVIGDGGSGFGITKTGAGTLTLSGANTFSGGLNLNAGTVSTATVAGLGTGTVSFNGGTLAITAAVDPSAQFSQAANQVYSINNSAAVTFGTALTSAGGTLTKAGASTLTSTVANTFTGATTINGGSLALSGPGSLASTTINLQSANAGGGLLITNTGAGFNAINRVADNANINLNGGVFVIAGSDQATTNVAETVGSFTLGSGSINGNTTNIITVTPGTGGSTTLTAGAITRAAGATMALVNGPGLGSTAASTSQFFVTTAPTLVGTTVPSAAGINAAAKDTQIVTGLVGETTATTGGVGTSTGLANTFLTYTTTGGFRPLNLTDEFTQSVVTAGTNVRTTAATSMTTNTAINSLVINGSTAALNTLTLTTGTTLTVSSGMLLFAPTANVTSTITGGTVAFGANEGLVYAGGTTGSSQTIASAVTGSNGLTVSGPGNVVFSGAVTLSGGTLVNAQHFLTLSNTGNNFAGASIVSSAGTGGILFNQALTAFSGASRVTATNGSQLRFNGATQGTFSSVPMTLGDANTSGNIYLQRSGDNADWTFPGQLTLSGPTSAIIQGFNAGSNSYIFSGGITGTGAGGLELQANANNATYYDRITLGGTLNYAGPTYLSNDSNLRVALNATTLPTGTVLNFRAATASRTAQFDLNGNAQTVAGLQSLGTTGVAQIINSNATAASLTVNNSANYTFAGNLGTVGAVNAGGTVSNTTGGSTTTVILAAGTSNGFSLVKTGAGTLTLSGAGSFTGGTTINGGKILITNATALGTGGVTIGTGANVGTLGTSTGALSIANVVTTSGTGSILAPGATTITNNGAVGMLTLTGGLNLGAGATIPFDLAGTTATSDVINVTGGTFTGATGNTNSGSITFAFNNLGVPGTATTYALINYTGATAADVDLGDFSATGVAGNFMFNANGTELDFVTTAVPEPSTYVGGLLMLGVVGWSVRGRFARHLA